MIRSIAMLAAVSGLALAQAQNQPNEHDPHAHHDHHAMQADDAGGAPIKITINPEARVAVSRGRAIPSPAACGKPMELPVKIVNQGFVTARLLAKLVGSVPPGVSLEFSPEPLKGTPEENRVLRLMLSESQVVDVTIAFRAEHDIPDLGGRDRVHLLVRCKPGKV